MTKVRCPICHNWFVEINLPHLRQHNLTIDEYDAAYPHSPRMSIERRRSKSRYHNLTPEMSVKLKFSQSLDGFIQKHGPEDGIIRWNAVRSKKSKSKTLDSYIERHGEALGPVKYDEYRAMNAVKMTLEGFMLRYGAIEGTNRYESYRSNQKRMTTLDGYILKYGTTEGQRRWSDKHNKNSASSRRIPVESAHLFNVYKQQVTRITRREIKANGLANTILLNKHTHSVDHKFSVAEGFNQSVPPYIIGSIYNLEVISKSANSSKQDKCSILLDDLCKLVLGH